MRLGNSNGNNKGKKFLRKDEIDIVFAGKADHFNEWISQNYNSLVLLLKSKGVFDEDIFNITYLNIYENVFFGGLDPNCYKNYLMRAYYTNYINDKESNSKRKVRFFELLPNIDKDDIDSEYCEELSEKEKSLVSDSFNYIYSKYNIRDFELFKMYISLKPAINYATLAKITKLKAHNIQRTISKIKKDIRDNKDFANRRKDIL